MAFVKIGFFPKHLKDTVKFDVEMNPIPIDDGKGKDVTVNW